MIAEGVPDGIDLEDVDGEERRGWKHLLEQVNHVVVSAELDGKSMLDSQRLVYSTITHLMTGEGRPVHVVDKLVTWTPE